jgi:heme/copper-type cytochrome/quinol oxidase subunit 3
MSAGQLAIVLVLTSLSVLFIASIVAYLVTRAQTQVWRSERTPGLPLGLIGSSALILAVSASVQRALNAVRQNRLTTLTRSLYQSLIFASAFVVGQLFNWVTLWRETLAAGEKTLFVATFFMLTGLHALHVIGGFVPLGIVIARARRREYSSSRYQGVLFCAQYWHFLGVVWFVLLVTLWLGS